MKTPSDDENKLFFDLDSEFEYQLKLKPRSNQQNGTDAQSAAAVMDLVAVLMMDDPTLSGGDVESSATVYVNRHTATK